MKKILLLTALLVPLLCFGQTYKLYQTRNIHNHLQLNTATGAVKQIQDDGQSWLVSGAIEPNATKANRFKLYETRNMWNFIELDTYTGRLWQVQFSVDGVEYMGSWPINTIRLSFSNSSVFDIEPMVSMYQFYLINGNTGATWQFQWSTEGEDYRWIKAL